MNTSQQTKPPRSIIPYLLMLGPVLVVIASFITLYLVMRYPDTEWKVDKVTEIHTEHGTHQHVTNSVTPPLR
jgi:hypothetical protein